MPGYGTGYSDKPSTVPNITPLRKTIASHMGEVLTPEIAAAIELSAYETEDVSRDPALFGQVLCGAFTIQVERFSDILDELHVLHQAHWMEMEDGYRQGLPLNPNYDAMAADERAGRMLQFTVRQGVVLVGNLRMYVFPSRHTGTLMASEDTLYLTPTARGGMTAIALMRFGEHVLRSLGVREITGDSKLSNNSGALMRRLGYELVAHKFYKVFKD